MRWLGSKVAELGVRRPSEQNVGDANCFASLAGLESFRVGRRCCIVIMAAWCVTVVVTDNVIRCQGH